MAITEFVIPSFKQEANSISTFFSTLAPFLSDLLDNADPGPKQRLFGKLLQENGMDTSQDFRPCLGLGQFILFSLVTQVHPINTTICVNNLSINANLPAYPEWENPEDFYTLVSSEGFKTFSGLAKPHSTAPPNPQLYETDLRPVDVFTSKLTEVWHVKIGQGDGEEAKAAWKVFVDALGGGRGI